jgi:DNA repair protein RadA/Sms
VILSIVSSIKNIVIPSDWIAFGEVGLTGEVRPVYNAEERIQEAKKHGYKVAIIPKLNSPKKKISGIEIVTVSYLVDAIRYLLKESP